jgi:hypothetical protein
VKNLGFNNATPDKPQKHTMPRLAFTPRHVFHCFIQSLWYRDWDLLRFLTHRSSPFLVWLWGRPNDLPLFIIQPCAWYRVFQDTRLDCTFIVLCMQHGVGKGKPIFQILGQSTLPSSWHPHGGRCKVRLRARHLRSEALRHRSGLQGAGRSNPEMSLYYDSPCLCQVFRDL